MASTPQFIASALVGIAQLTTANTNRDGTGTIVDLVPANADADTRILEVRIKATGTVADCLINLFYWDGAAWRFFDDIAVASKTPSATEPAAESSAEYLNLVVPLGTAKLGASITITPASAVNVFALGGVI